jgi:hypothetical protein
MSRIILMPIMIFMTRFYHNSKQYCRSYSVLFHKLFFILPVVIIWLSFSLSSCEENPTIIGSNLLPSSDFVNIKSTDTIGVSAYTQFIKSVITNNLTYSYLGKTYDPYFGETKTDFVCQLRLLQKWPGGGPFSVDSVTLTFTIQGAKGIIDTDFVHKIKLYEITEQLNSSTKYYSDNDPHVGNEIGTFDLPVIPKDSIQTITITLPVAFGEYLMRDTIKLTQEDDANDFRSFFKGLYVTLDDPPNPLMMALQFTSSATTGEIFYPYVTVYYHSFKSGNSLTFDFVMNANSVRYNRYIRTPSTDATRKIKHINDGIKDSMIYLQAFNGVYPRIKIPGLAYFKNNMTRISINKASLSFSVFLDSSNFTATTLPSLIMMKYFVTDTSQYIVPDYYVSSSFYGGSFSTSSLTYSFNIASFVQQYIEGNISEPVIEMYFPTGEYKNVILKANNSYKPAKFEFVYTRY